jgi:hypothetical protein
MEHLPDEEIPCAADDLLIFIDDTGHESFTGNQEYYGLGGCAVLGAHYGRLKTLWMDVRHSINGSPDAPLHASDMSIRSSGSYAILSKFFLDRSFARFAVAALKSAILPAGMHPATPVMGAVQEDIASLACHIPCAAVTIIVESSQRADPILMQCFGELKPDGVDLTIPVNHCLMPKSGAEPGLEIADFIISAAGSQVQRHLRGKQGPAPDFGDVFCRLPVEGCLFSIIGAVADNPQNRLVQVLRFYLPGNALSSDGST